MMDWWLESTTHTQNFIMGEEVNLIYSLIFSKGTWKLSYVLAISNFCDIVYCLLCVMH